MCPPIVRSPWRSARRSDTSGVHRNRLSQYSQVWYAPTEAPPVDLSADPSWTQDACTTSSDDRTEVRAKSHWATLCM
eukprot:13264791-Alexandrium_andersonii.AAC.1